MHSEKCCNDNFVIEIPIDIHKILFFSFHVSRFHISSNQETVAIKLQKQKFAENSNYSIQSYTNIINN